MTRAELREVVTRYVAGEKPAAIAAALELDVDEVARACTGPTSVGAVAKAVAGPRPKRVRKAPADASASPRAPGPAAEAGDVADPGRVLRGRNGVTSQRNYGFGYAAVVTGRRPM